MIKKIVLSPSDSPKVVKILQELSRQKEESEKEFENKIIASRNFSKKKQNDK